VEDLLPKLGGAGFIAIVIGGVLYIFPVISNLKKNMTIAKGLVAGGFIAVLLSLLGTFIF
jgi:hypothetical protein